MNLSSWTPALKRSLDVSAYHILSKHLAVIDAKIYTRRVILVLLDVIKYAIDDKEMITDVPVAPGTNVAAAHGGVNLVIDVIIDQLVEDGSDFDNIKDTSVVVEI